MPPAAGFSLVFLLVRLERDGHAVVAIAKPRRVGAVVEDVALVAAALGAVVFGARHEQLAVFLGLDMPGNGFKEARPTRAAVEFGFRTEQRQAAARAFEHALAVLFQKRAGEGALRPLVAQHIVLLGGEFFFPVCVAHSQLLDVPVVCKCSARPPEAKGDAGQQGGYDEFSSVHEFPLPDRLFAPSTH